jgi:N12 class adenine-specific DNA methylase
VRLTFPCIIALLCMATLALGQEAKETMLKPGDVPAAVTQAVTKQYPNAKVSSWSKELEDGKTTYEASVSDGSFKRDVVFAEDGSLLAVEEAIQISDLPAAVKSAIRNKYPGASLRKAEKILHGEQVQYEVALAKAPKKEVLVTPAGKIIKEE